MALESHTASQPNRFERHPRLTLLILVLALFAVLELAAGGVLLALDYEPYRSLYASKEPLRTLSGFTVARPTPFSHHRAIASWPENTVKGRVDTDEHGFIAAAPVRVDKPENVIRIFMIGGSALLGAGQTTHPYGQLHRYPHGVFSYDLSIGGQLAKVLSSEHPETRFEVVTAAMHNQTLLQGFLRYLEVVSRYKPDIVVSMDGYNDVQQLAAVDSGRDPYRWLEESFLREFVALDTLKGQGAGALSRISLLQLPRALRLEYQIAMRDRGRLTGSRLGEYYQIAERAIPPEDVYRAERGALVTHSQRLLQLMRFYGAALREDRAHWVFVLQPMLYRPLNKPLSEIEHSFRDRIQLGPDRRQMDLVSYYFIDDYLSGQLRRIVEAAGGDYIDANHELTNLGADTEFYTDYCHLTPRANEILARLVAAELDERLRRELALESH